MSIPAGRRSRMLSRAGVRRCSDSLCSRLAAPASAQGGNGEGNGIDVVQVEGCSTRANVALIMTRVARRRSSRFDAARGATRRDRRSRRRRRGTGRGRSTTRDPVGVWVGPSGSNARGASALLALHAPVVSRRRARRHRARRPGALRRAGTPPRDEVADRVARRARRQRPRARQRRRRRESTPLGRRRRRLGATNSVAPTLGEFIVSLDGRRWTSTDARSRSTPPTSSARARTRRLQPNQEVRFHKLDLAHNSHTRS